ncbi:MAG: hypothetical protein PHU25_01320 [Deltaproteobacteria bacterium]|nr:hypothetical protein [Deltaproteobacteria bacterium]
MDAACPKCGTQRDRESCPRCGLVFEKFDPTVLEEGVPDALKALWLRVEEAWDDRARHALFVEQALAQGCAGYAAFRYRLRGEDPMAKEQLERLVRRFDEILAASAPPRGRSVSRRTFVLLLVASAVVMGAMLFIMTYAR